MRNLRRKLVYCSIKPSAMIIAVLVIANGLLLGSILGIDVFSANKVTLLSTTTELTFGYSPQIPAIEDIQSDNVRSDKLEAPVWETLRMKVTAYCACRKCCGKYANGRTANNHRIRNGDVFTAADKKFRFGTELIVPGYNNNEPVKVLDRGRVIKGNRLDVFYNSHRRAQKWGVKYLDVQVKQ